MKLGRLSRIKSIFELSFNAAEMVFGDATAPDQCYLNIYGNFGVSCSNLTPRPPLQFWRGGEMFGWG